MKVKVVEMNGAATITLHDEDKYRAAFGITSSSPSTPYLWGTQEAWFRLMGRHRTTGKLRIFRRKGEAT